MSTKGIKMRERTSHLRKAFKRRNSEKSDGGEARNKEQLETPVETTSVTPVKEPVPGGAVPAEEETEESESIEMPPPMKEIHTMLPSQPAGSQENVSSLTLKPDPATTSADLAVAIENMMKTRMTPDTPGSSIEGVAEGEDNQSMSEMSATDKSEEEESRAKYLRKREFVIQELISTEKDYVQDLQKIVDNYICAMNKGPLPEGMDNGKDRKVLGNIEQIYEWHRDTFTAELEKCAKEPERVGGIFIRLEKRLYSMYVKYCQNKPTSEHIVAEFIDYFEDLRVEFGHRLGIPDLLIKPVQRIMKYQLLLKEILKYTEKAGEDTKDLLRAVEVMKVVPKAANDMMNMGRLQGYTGKIAAAGKLLLHDTLLVMEISQKVKPTDQKFRERKVFLFDQIVIISEEVGPKKNNLCSSSYIFKNNLMVNKMGFNEKGTGEPMTFTLTDKSPGGNLMLHFQAPSSDTYHSWCSQIRSILDMQKDLMSALQYPISYQKELTKESSTPEFGSIQRSTILRKTQSQPNPQKPPSSRKSHDDIAEGKSGLCDTFSAQKSSCPSSPTEKDLPSSDKIKLEMVKTAPGTLGSSSRPKRTLFDGFRNTLRPKSRISEERDSNSSGGSSRKGGATPSGSLRKSGAGADLSSSPLDLSTEGAAAGLESAEEPTLEPRPESMPDLLQSSQGNDSYCSLPRLQTVALTPFELVGAIGGSGTLGADIKWKSSRETAANEDASLMEGSTSGTASRVNADYTAVKEDEISVNRGESVTVLSTSQHNMILVFREANHSSPAAEGWIPAHLIGTSTHSATVKEVGDNGFRKSWAMKLRKPSLGSRKEMKTGSLDRGMRKDRDHKTPIKSLRSEDFQYEVVPSFTRIPADVATHTGGAAVLTCCVCGRPRPNVMWIAPDQTTLSDGPRVTITHDDDGTVTLRLSGVDESNQGEYTVIANNEKGSETATAMLMVIDKSTVAGQPIVKDQSGTSLQLEWEAPTQPTTPLQGYTIDTRVTGSEQWQTCVANIVVTSYIVNDLQPGVTYHFRVICNLVDSISAPSEVSVPVSIPSEMDQLDDDDPSRGKWKTTFEKDYRVVSEISRGRFCIVKKCVEIGTGRDVAAKFVTKKLVGREGVESEHSVIMGLQHANIVTALDLYNTAMSYVIVLQLLPDGRLFDLIVSRPRFDETQAAGFIQQVLNATQYLHNCRIAHLDIKPENLMVDLTNSPPKVKIIDFGDARQIYNSYYTHPLIGSPEFAAPELVSGNPVGLLSDIWSVAVVTYVMLSGVSPFLDESPEETCSNIIRTDFSFPEEYFTAVSEDAKQFMSTMLVNELHQRPTSQMCMAHAWIQKLQTTPALGAAPLKSIPTAKLIDFIERRKHQNDIEPVRPPRNY